MRDFIIKDVISEIKYALVGEYIKNSIRKTEEEMRVMSDKDLIEYYKDAIQTLSYNEGADSED